MKFCRGLLQKWVIYFSTCMPVSAELESISKIAKGNYRNFLFEELLQTIREGKKALTS